MRNKERNLSQTNIICVKLKQYVDRMEAMIMAEGFNPSVFYIQKIILICENTITVEEWTETRMIIVNNPKYISSKDAVVDHDEYIEVVKNIDEIDEQALDYLEEYINWFCGKSKLSKKKYIKRYKYSTLKYFHKELGITNNQRIF